ncbi:hypothetical protein GEMRC1_001673 [Eukaryota sp. GEM-RC1]
MFSPVRRSTITDFQQPQVTRTSDEFHNVQYRLSSGLRSFSANILKLFNVSSPQLAAKFEKRNEGKLQLDSWVDTSLLADNNNVNDVLHRGFSFPPQGLRFTTGGLNLPSYSGTKRYEFLLCRVTVGRAFVAKDSSVQQIPPGYDSILFPSQSYGDLSTVSSIDAWKDIPTRFEDLQRELICDYLIHDSDHVVPCYLVQFEFDPSQIGRTPELICDVCEARPAVVFCHHDDARLCSSCDQQVHSANKIVSRHHRVPVKEQPQGFGTCLKHPDMPLEFFCPVCFEPICVHCKMIGSHASGEAAAHKLVPITDAYKQAVDSCRGSDLPLLDNRKHSLRNQLRKLEERRREVEQNGRNVEEVIYTVLQQALDNLKLALDFKNTVVLSEALEVRRQLAEVEARETFIQQAQSYLPPTEFLKAFGHHRVIRDELTRSPVLRTEIDVFPDLALVGAINVTSSDGAPKETNEFASFSPGPSSNLRAQLLKGSKMAGFLNPITSTPGQVSSTLNEPSPPINTPQLSSFSGFPASTGLGDPSSVNLNQSFSSFPSPKPTPSTVVKSSKPQEIWRSHLSRVKSDTLPHPTLEPPLPPNEQVSDEEVEVRHQDVSSFVLPSVEVRPEDGGGNQSVSHLTDSRMDVSSFVLPSQQSLSREAQKKISELKSTGMKLTSETPFEDSKILTSDQQKRDLYYSLPFHDQPSTRKFYSTYTHHRSLTTLHALCDSNGPTVVLIKYGDNVFGGYAGSPWNVNQTRFGTPKCFLFSVTKDSKIPYHGKGKQSRCLFGSPNCIAFGNTDLVLENDFQKCSSQIENSYGIGLDPNSSECSSYLAGVRDFVPEVIEVWGFEFNF